MLEKPDISEQLIEESVKAKYGLEVSGVTFLPLGYDVHTAVYRVHTGDQQQYFLKLRITGFEEFMVAIPHYLHQVGIHAIIDPLETLSGRLSAGCEAGEMILYPFIRGKNGYEVEMTEQQWAELGITLRKMHQVELPEHLMSMLPCELFVPAWRESTRWFLHEVSVLDYEDEVAQRLAEFMKDKQADIIGIVERADELASELQKQELEYVLCHADCHPGNYHIGEEGKFYLVDWDNPMLAPKERDLMFFGAGMVDEATFGPVEESFYEGYGKVGINLPAMVYYRYERIIQDIAEFCKQLLLSNEGDEDREQAYKYFTSNFATGGALDAARRLDEALRD